MSRGGGRVVVAALALASAAGCAADDGAYEVVELGVIQYFNDPWVLAIPSRATVGAPLAVSVDTYGGGCESLDHTDVAEVDGATVITPYVRRRVPGPNEGCLAYLTRFTHTAELTFATPGPHELKIVGRRVDRRGVIEIDQTIVLTRTIDVR